MGMKSTIFWNVTSCSPLKVNTRFGGKYRFYFRGRISRGKYRRKVNGKENEYSIRNYSQETLLNQLVNVIQSARPENLGSTPSRRKKFLFLAPCANWFRRPRSLLSNRYWGLLREVCELSSCLSNQLLGATAHMD